MKKRGKRWVMVS